MEEKAEAPSELLNLLPEFQTVIASFDARDDAYSISDVNVALRIAIEKLGAIPEEMKQGANAEFSAFEFSGGHRHDEPKGTYFRGTNSMIRDDGTRVDIPDPRDTTLPTLTHWKARAHNTKSPMLVARYSDLVWDIAPLVGPEKRDPIFARRAIDAYTQAASQPKQKAAYAFPMAERALSLSIQLKDDDRRAKARELILSLHKHQVTEPKGMWWSAWDIFERYSKADLSETEWQGLVTDLEAVLARVSKSDDPKNFDPHAVESVATKLIAYYRRAKSESDVKRVTLAIATAFERFGEMADPHLGSLVLRTSMDAYRAAGLADDAERIVKLIGEKNLASVAKMIKREHRFEIPQEKVEAYVNSIMQSTTAETLKAISLHFLLRRAQIEDELKRLAKVAPLASMISQTRISGDRITSEIGSLEDDLSVVKCFGTIYGLVERRLWLVCGLKVKRLCFDAASVDLRWWCV